MNQGFSNNFCLVPGHRTENFPSLSQFRGGKTPRPPPPPGGGVGGRGGGGGSCPGGTPAVAGTRHGLLTTSGFKLVGSSLQMLPGGLQLTHKRSMRCDHFFPHFQRWVGFRRFSAANSPPRIMVGPPQRNDVVWFGRENQRQCSQQFGE